MRYDNVVPPSPRSVVMRYAVSLRNCRSVDYANKREAIRAAKREAKDGWPSRVRDMWTAETIWRSE